MDYKDFKNHMDARLDRIENKLDDHIQRISKAEESINWISGHLKISTSLFVSALIGTLSALYNFMIK